MVGFCLSYTGKLKGCELSFFCNQVPLNQLNSALRILTGKEQMQLFSFSHFLMQIPLSFIVLYINTPFQALLNLFPIKPSQPRDPLMMAPFFDPIKVLVRSLRALGIDYLYYFIFLSSFVGSEFPVRL